jgi:hypothetical protein
MYKTFYFLKTAICGGGTNLLARSIMATSIVDRGYRLFDRVRSRTVLACASDEFYDVYNDLSFARQDMYRAGSKGFKANLFPFEERMISQHFPPPPGSVLIGAAGGGREAFILARRGYRVVAFDRVLGLATSLADFCGDLPIEVFVGRYEQLPMLSPLNQHAMKIDLRLRAPFAAAIMGWTSFSHLRSDEHCVDTLRHFGNLTHGPILVSFYPTWTGRSDIHFSQSVGFYRTFSGSEFRALAERAALKVIVIDDQDNWPHAVLQGFSNAISHPVPNPRLNPLDVSL